MTSDVSEPRRRFFGTAAATVAAIRFGAMSPAAAEPGAAAAPFGPLKQADAGPLSVGYVEIGPEDGPAAVLLHGRPYDIHAFAEVAPMLAARGWRVIVPHLRGFGTTRFLSAGTLRNGQQSVVAVDIVALMDALGIRQAVIGGFDWGARTADIIAALWPERCRALVSVSGYLIGSQAAGRRRCRRRPSCNGGISSISPPSAAAPATTNTAANSRG